MRTYPPCWVFKATLRTYSSKDKRTVYYYADFYYLGSRRFLLRNAAVFFSRHKQGRLELKNLKKNAIIVAFAIDPIIDFVNRSHN